MSRVYNNPEVLTVLWILLKRLIHSYFTVVDIFVIMRTIEKETHINTYLFKIIGS